MSVDTEVSSIEYAGNNSTSTAYTIPFPFLETTDIKCQVKPLHGEYEELDADAFTVIRDGDGEGGTLTTATAVATSGAVYISGRAAGSAGGVSAGRVAAIDHRGTGAGPRDDGGPANQA